MTLMVAAGPTRLAMRGPASLQTGSPPMLLHPAGVERQLKHKELSAQHTEPALGDGHTLPTQQSSRCRQSQLYIPNPMQLRGTL